MKKFSKQYKEYYNKITMDKKIEEEILNKTTLKNKKHHNYKYLFMYASIIIFITFIISISISISITYAENIYSYVKDNIIEIKDDDNFINIKKIPPINKNANVYANLKGLKTIQEFENILNIDILESNLIGNNITLNYKFKNNQNKLTRILLHNVVDIKNNNLCNHKFCEEEGKIVISYNFVTSATTEGERTKNIQTRQYLKDHVSTIYNDKLETTMIILCTTPTTNNDDIIPRIEILFEYKEILYNIKGQWVSNNAILEVINSFY